jgi:hypothetical protein
MQTRACWVYQKYGNFEFTNPDHLRAACNKICEHLYSPHMPVKVEAALAISQLLEHETAVEFIRPNLGSVIDIFLRIMDEIDFDELITALKKIVVIYENEIAPHAEKLCQKLSESYVRITNGGKVDWNDVDTQEALNSDSLITAIRRVLNSISGKFPELYPRLEAILEQSLYICLSQAG